MTKNLKDIIIERNEMQAEYAKEIFSRFGDTLTQAISNSLFNGVDIDLSLEDINIINQNDNYAFLVLLIVKEPSLADSAELRAGSTLNFAIPLELLDKGTTEDISEYIALLKERQAAEEPIPINNDYDELVQKIIDKIKKNVQEEADEPPVDEISHELDNTQKELLKLLRVTKTQH